MEHLILQLVKEIGEDPSREGLDKTPTRVAKAWEYLTSGYKQDVHEVLNEALFTEEYDEMVVVKDIDLYSICEHHLHPARLQHIVSRGRDLGGEPLLHLQPRGVAVVIEAIHMCMLMRGVEKQ